MIATPCGPSAVPTGGAGVAAPAGIWIFTTAATFFFAITFLASGSSRVCQRRLELRHLGELELDRRLAAEDVDQHLELELVLVDLDDLAGEVGERAFLDADGLTGLVLETGTAPLGGLLLVVGRDEEELLDVAPRQRRGLRALADEAGDARRVADDVPRVVVELAAHEEVAREDLLLDDDLLAVLELDDVFHRDDDLVDALLHVHGRDACLEVLLDLLLVARLGVHHIPAAGTVVRALDRRTGLLVEQVVGVDHLVLGDLVVGIGLHLVVDEHRGRALVFVLAAGSRRLEITHALKRLSTNSPNR